MLASSFTNAKTAKPCSVQRPETAAFIAHMAQSSARLFKNSTGVALEGQHPGATSDMTTKTFTNGRIKKADYDHASQQLDLHWDNKTVLAYKQVPQEVYRRLCSAPNPATYWEDRIAEEYPKGTPMTSSVDPDGAKKLGDLFGDRD